jgi:HK97 gp10 family phage protein
MSADFDFTVQGGAELAKRLAEIPPKLENKVLRAAVRAGSVVIANEAKSRAPVLREPDPRRNPGTLKKAIKPRSTKVVKGLVSGGVAVRMLSAAQIQKFKAAGGSKGANNPNDPFYARWVEYGTVKMAAQPFMRPALSSKAQAAIDEVARVTAAGLDEVVK